MTTDLQHGFDRRAVSRFEYFARVIGECLDDRPNRFFEGRIGNLSLNGLGLVAHRPLKAGETVALVLHHATGIYRCERLVRVVASRAEDNGSWQVNCEFLEPLSRDELRLFQVQDFTPRYPPPAYPGDETRQS